MTTSKKVMIAVLVGLVLGALATTAIRFGMYKFDIVHYHANFALFINDTRDKFDGPGYYEEEQACSSTDLDNPKSRVHMHDQNSGLVHVHAHAVTWGQFFDNLGYGVSDKAITTGSAVYVDGQDGNKLIFELNGQTVTSIADRVIKSDDVLLINYGQDTAAVLKQHYDAVPRDAHKNNTEKDPAACSGSEPVTFTERLKKALGF